MADDLTLAERTALKGAVSGVLRPVTDDPAQLSLLRQGLIRADGDHMVVTLSGHLLYLTTLPAQFEQSDGS